MLESLSIFKISFSYRYKTVFQKLLNKEFQEHIKKSKNLRFVL
jgi:hypothetical protein